MPDTPLTAAENQTVMNDTTMLRDGMTELLTKVGYNFGVALLTIDSERRTLAHQRNREAKNESDPDQQT